MTTELNDRGDKNVIFLDDVRSNDFAWFIDDVKRLDQWKSQFDQKPQISGVRYQAAKAEYDIDVVERASRAITTRLRDSDEGIWLFVAHRPWQPNSRVINHRRLWRHPSLKVHLWASTQERFELRLSRPSEVRFASCCGVPSQHLSDAINLCLHSDLAICLVTSTGNLANEDAVRSLFRRSFPDDRLGEPTTYVNWGNVILDFALDKALIVRQSGNFDELRWSIDVYCRHNDSFATTVRRRAEE
jgi:hypothetical protein